MATVLVSPEAQEQFGRLPLVIRARMEKLLARLEHWPAVSGAKPLAGNLAGHWRLRTGDYRLQFQVRPGDAEADPPMPDTVLVEKIGHRDGFY